MSSSFFSYPPTHLHNTLSAKVQPCLPTVRHLVSAHEAPFCVISTVELALDFHYFLFSYTANSNMRHSLSTFRRTSATTRLPLVFSRFPDVLYSARKAQPSSREHLPRPSGVEFARWVLGDGDPWSMCVTGVPRSWGGSECAGAC